MINKNCYYCKKPSALYLKSSESHSGDQFNFASTEIDAKDTEKKPNLFICKSCDIIFSEYCDEPFEDHYKDVLDNQYIEQIEYKKEYFNFIIKKLSDQISSNDEILEIGSYYGAFGSQIVSKVKNYTGIELSGSGSDFAKKNFNLNIINTDIYSFFQNNKKKYDIIFMFDVVEHLDDPNIVIDFCSKSLKNGGKLILSTMNMDSLFAKITGRNYPWIIPMHKFYFTDRSLEKMLNKNKLTLYNKINDVRIISLEYLFYKISQKISIFKICYKILKKINFIKKLKIKFSLFDLCIYCSQLKK